MPLCLLETVQDGHETTYASSGTLIFSAHHMSLSDPPKLSTTSSKLAKF